MHNSLSGETMSFLEKAKKAAKSLRQGTIGYTEQENIEDADKKVLQFECRASSLGAELEKKKAEIKKRIAKGDTQGLDILVQDCKFTESLQQDARQKLQHWQMIRAQIETKKSEEDYKRFMRYVSPEASRVQTKESRQIESAQKEAVRRFERTRTTEAKREDSLRLAMEYLGEAKAEKQDEVEEERIELVLE